MSALAVLAACSSAEPGQPTGTPAPAWFEPAARELPAACGTFATPPALTPVAVDVFHGRVDTDTARTAVREFAGYARTFGIELVPASASAHPIAIEDLFTASHAELRHQGTSERDKSAAMLAPVRLFLAANGGRRPDRINLVLVDEVVPSRSALAAHLSGVAGLAFSPLLEVGGETDGLAPLLGLRSYRPTLFVSMRVLETMSALGRVTTFMHELGHALGLPHTAARSNVMAAVRRGDCAPILSPAQLETLHAMASGLGGEAHR